MICPAVTPALLAVQQSGAQHRRRRQRHDQRDRHRHRQRDRELANRRPTMPPMKSSGMKTAMSERLIEST
jgi:hypothetical protein